MFCIVAFVVLSILGIFSATNRALARESLDCVFRRVTFRPCNTGFDEKVKARILGSVITRSETAARVLNKNFELLSWIFFFLLLASSVWSVRGLYLFYTTGSCNGLNASGFCVFDPAGNNNQVSASVGCAAKPPTESDVNLKDVDLTGMAKLDQGSKDEIMMIGCYHCDYTRKAYPMIRDMVSHYKVNFVFFNYPTKETNDYFTRLSYCVNQQAPEKFWEFNDIMFSGDKSRLDDATYMNKMLEDLGLSMDTLTFCTGDPLTESTVQKQMREIEGSNFYGTPTVFIHSKAFVGPKPYRVYAIALEGLLFWLK
ncbi:MAG: thioredoxin domain-containing protein [Anaerolineaceae bacterium]|nr:thioredoxin domain-containing protein [Anaerolineaceae bacterium]